MQNGENNINQNTQNNDNQLGQEEIASKELLICQKCLEKINQINFPKTSIENEKSLLIEKTKLDLFEKNIGNASNMKKHIKENINLVINELKEKIENIEQLSKTFFESLEIEIKFSKLLYENYQQELKNNNLNSFIVKNLESHINFYIPELNINEKDSLKGKIDTIITYLNNSINNKFQKYEMKKKKENIDVDYKLKTSIDFGAKGLFNYNNKLLGLYNCDTIKFITKNKFEDKITIKESLINNIKLCQKNEGNKIVVFTLKYFFFIQIFEEYNEYMILDKKFFSEYESLTFNSNLDLFKLTEGYNEMKIELLLFPEYNEVKLEHSFSKCNQFLLIKDNLFFCIVSDYTKLYLIDKDKCKELQKYEIYIYNKENSAIDLNEDFIVLNTLNKLYLFNKKSNYFWAKTINLDYESDPPTSIFKINNKIVSLFIRGEQMKLINYEISIKGLKWKQINTKTIVNDKISYYKQFNENDILFLGEKKCYFIEFKLNKKDN